MNFARGNFQKLCEDCAKLFNVKNAIMPYLTEPRYLSMGKQLIFTDRFFLTRVTDLIQSRSQYSVYSRNRASVSGYPKKSFDPKTCA